MRYQCLVLDHDDTVVNSTATINYPAFVQTLQKLRPDVHMTLDDFFFLLVRAGLRRCAATFWLFRRGDGHPVPDVVGLCAHARARHVPPGIA